MMGDGQYLDLPIFLSVDHIKVKNPEHGAANVGGKSDARASWICADKA